MQVRCPHCQNPVEIVDGSSFRELSCSSCGSGFSLVPDETLAFQPDEVRTLGHFELTERIGVGAFGTVWKARDIELDRTVAVKIPRKDQLSEHEIEQFLREARAAAQLKHPSIVGVHEAGRDAETVFIVSDYIDGLTLADWLTGHRPPVRAAVELVAKIADALQAAHERGVIHRDLKPSNIILNDKNEPHVMDFGLAKREGTEVTMTVDGQVLGTPAYMAPEQARGDAHHSDARSDVYSLGVILFELLTGETPFRGNARMLLHQVIKEEAPSPRRLNANVPRDIETITLRCLEKEPENRFQTAAELSADLKRFLNHEPVLSRPIGPVARTRRWCRRYPVVSSLAGLIGAILVVGIAVVSALWIRAESNAEKAREFGSKYQAEAERAQSLAASESDARTEAELRLVDLYTTTGLSSNDAQASLWFANAVEKSSGFPNRQRTNNIRFGAWKKLLPAPIAVLDLEGSRVKRLQWHPSLPVILVEILEEDCLLWDLRGGSPLRPVGATCGDWSPDGTSLALGTERGEVGIFSFPGGELIDQISHRERVHAVEFSPDGAYLAIGGKEARLWDIRGRDFAGESFRHPRPLVSLKFSADSKRLMTVCESAEARLFAIADGKLEMLMPPLPHNSVGYGNRGAGNRTKNPYLPAFLKNGEQVLTSPDKSTLVWHDVESGAKRREMGITERDDMPPRSPKGPPIRLVSVATAFDTSQLLVGTTYKNLLFNITEGKTLVLPAHRHDTKCAAFTHDGKVVATASRSVKFWRTSDGSPVEGGVIRHQDYLITIEFSPQDDLVATAQHNGLVRVCTTPFAGNSLARHIPVQGGGASLVEVSTNGQFFLPTGTSCVRGALRETRAYHADTGEPAGAPLAPEGLILDCAFSPTGDRIATICADVTEPQERQGIQAAIAEIDGRLDIWDRVAGERLIGTVPFATEPRCVDFSPDGRLVGVVCAKGDAYLVDAKTGKAVHHFQVGGWRNGAEFVSNGMLRFGPQGNLLAVWGFLGSTHLFEVDSGKRLHRLKCHTHDLDFSPDGKYLATASYDKTARIWDLESGAQVGQPIEHPGWLFRARFSEDGEQLLTACRDRMARLWNWRAGRLACPAFQHDDEVMDARFIPQTPWILTASHDLTARAWDSKTGKPITPSWPLGGMGWSLAVTPNGRHAAVSGQMNEVLLFDLNELHAPLEFPVAEMRAWAQLVSGEEVHPGGGITNLPQSDWLQRWPLVHHSSLQAQVVGNLTSLKAEGGTEALAHVRDAYRTEFGWLQKVRDANDHIKRNQLPEATAVYQQITEDHAEDFQSWYTLAMLQGVQGKWQASEKAAKQAVELAPHNAQCHRALLRAQASQKDYEAALATSSILVDLADSEIDDWYTRALLVRATNDDDEYRRCCQRTLAWFANAEPDPNDVNTLIWIHCLGPQPLDEIKPVRQLAEQLNSGSRRTPELLNTLGAVLLRAGNVAASRERLSEAIAMQKGNGKAWDHLFLAMAAYQEGATAEYHGWLQKAETWAAANLIKTVSADPLDGWRVQLELQILKQEAERLDESKSK